MANTRQEQKLQTYELLCDAAIQLFSSNGVEKTNIQDITSMAGVSVGSFYTHFKNKQDLLEHLMVTFSQKFTDYVAAIMDRPFENLEDAVRTHFTAVFDYHGSRPQLSQLWTSYRSYISQETSRICDQEINEFLHALYREHFYATDLDPEIAVQATIGLSHHIMTWWNIDRSRKDINTMIEGLTSIALGGLHLHIREPEDTAAAGEIE